MMTMPHARNAWYAGDHLDVTDGHDAMCRYAAKHKRG
jgi:hypothetical protein